MTLTVRLKPELESALELQCAERGVSKSLLVQEALAEYLGKAPARKARHATASGLPTGLSANYRAFEALGLIGCVAGVGPADKARVRARIAESFAQRKARRGGV